MASSFSRPRNALSARPSRTTGTMGDWSAWIDNLSRHERDQLYPGMHKDLIPAYEKIMAMEEENNAPTPAGFSSQTSVTPPAVMPAAKPVSPFGPAAPLLSMAPVPAPYMNTPPAAPPVAGYEKPWTPAAAPHSIAGQALAFGSTPNAGPGNTVLSPLQQPSAFGSRPAPGIASFASSATSPTMTGSDAGTAIKKGLLDLSYAEQPETAPQNSVTARSAAATGSEPGSNSKNAEYGFREAWGRFTKVVGDAIEVTAEGYRFAEDFAKYMVEAPREVQLEFLKDFLVFVGSLTGVGNAANLINLMINNPEERNAYNVISLVVGFLPVAVALKIAPRFYKFMDRATRKFKAARRERKGGGNKRPGSRRYSQAEAQRLLNRHLEFLFDSMISTFWEVLDQHFGGNSNPGRAGVQGISGGLSEFLDNPDDTKAAAIGKEVALVFATQLLSLMTEENGLDLDEDWKAITTTVGEAFLIGVSTGFIKKVLDRAGRKRPKLRKAASYFKQPISLAVEFAVSTLYRRITGEAERSGVENTRSVLTLGSKGK